MKPEVLKNDLASEYYTEERCHIIETANDANDEQVSIARARVEPGITTAWHKLIGVTERYVIVSGQGCVELGDMDPVDVAEGDVVRIPADTPQRITNTGESDLIFFAICSPRFVPSCYVNTELMTPRPEDA